MPLIEGDRFMTCTCPKCAANLEFDVAQIPDSGLSTKCSGCKVRLQVSREPFLRRAYRKAGDISCAHCGAQLSHYLNCHSCGILFPDYFVAETPNALRQRTRKTSGAFSNLRNISFEWRSTPAKKQSYQPIYTPETATAGAGSQPFVAAKRSALVKIVSVVTIIAALAGGYVFYSHHQSKRQYAANVVRSLYVMKTGTELSLKSCTKLSADWKARIDAGSAGAPRIAADEEARLTKLKDETEKLFELLANPPKAYAPASEKLVKLKSAYTNLYSLTTAPSGALPRFVEATARAESEYKQALQELKAAMPDELKEELEKARAKTKGLKDI
jgi:hypothetical protein